MDQKSIIHCTVDFVKETLKGAESGHDWWHIERVWKLALKIAEEEKADLLIAEERHLFMEKFLMQFYAEWNGEK